MSNPIRVNVDNHHYQQKSSIKTNDIDRASNDFNEYFLSHVIRLIHQEQKPDSLFGGGRGEEIFKDFLLNAYVKEISPRISVINDMVYQQLSKITKNSNYEAGNQISDTSHSSSSAFVKPDIENTNEVKININKKQLGKAFKTVEQMVQEDGIDINI